MKYTATALMILLGATACSPSAQQDAAAPAATESAPITAPITAENLTGFVEKVGISDMFEIEAAKIAQQRSKTTAIKDFARMMTTDHTASSAQLKAILASDTSAPGLPTALDQAHLDKLAALRTVEAAKFDELYVDQQTDAHENALRLLRDYGAAGDNASVQAFANELAPKVDAHLTAIRAIDAADVDEPPATKS